MEAARMVEKQRESRWSCVNLSGIEKFYCSAAVLARWILAYCSPESLVKRCCRDSLLSLKCYFLYFFNHLGAASTG